MSTKKVEVKKACCTKGSKFVKTSRGTLVAKEGISFVSMVSEISVLNNVTSVWAKVEYANGRSYDIRLNDKTEYENFVKQVEA